MVLDIVVAIANEHAHLKSKPVEVDLGEIEPTLAGNGIIFEPPTRKLYMRNGGMSIAFGECILPERNLDNDIVYSREGAKIIYV